MHETDAERILCKSHTHTLSASVIQAASQKHETQRSQDDASDTESHCDGRKGSETPPALRATGKKRRLIERRWVVLGPLT